MERNRAVQALCAVVLLASSAFGQSVSVFDFYLTKDPSLPSVGTFRIGNNQLMAWESNPAGADATFTYNALNIFEFTAPLEAPTMTQGGVAVPTISSTDTLTNKTLDSATNTITGSYPGIVGLGTVTSGTWQGSPVDIPFGGTGEATAQAAINSLTNVAGANAGDVLTKVGADALWAAPASGGHTIRDRAEAALAERTFLKFSVPLNATDDAANDQTVAQLDSSTLTPGDPMVRGSWLIPIQQPGAQIFESVTVSQLGGSGAGLTDAYANLTAGTGSTTANLSDTINFSQADPLLTTSVSGNNPSVVTYDFGGTFANLNAAITDATLLRTADIGSTVQAWDAGLDSLATLGTAADRMAYTTAINTWAETPLTPFSRTVLDDSSQGDWQATLNVDPAGTDNSTDVTLAGENYLTINGSQQITAGRIDILSSHIADITTDRLLGRSTAGAGVPELITIGAGLDLTAGVLSSTAGGGHTILDRDDGSLTQRANLKFERPLHAVDLGAGPDATAGRIDFSTTSGVPAIASGTIPSYKVLVQDPNSQGAGAFGTVTVSELGGAGAGIPNGYSSVGTDSNTITASGEDTFNLVGGAMMATDGQSGAPDQITLNFGGTLAELNTAITDATLDDASDPRTPTSHASTHQPGGADPVAVTVPAVDSIPATTGVSDRLDSWISTGSTTVPGLVELATDGESAANVVVQGNDARLSDARAPTAHAATHQPGGGDPVGTTTPAINAIPATTGASDRLDAWISTADTSTAGIVELATDGEAIGNRAVQGNDTRLEAGAALTTEGDLLTFQAGSHAKIGAGTLNHYFRSAGPSTIPVYGELEIVHDLSPVLGADMETKGNLIVGTDGDDLVNGVFGALSASRGVAMVFTDGAGPFDTNDGAVTVEAGLTTIYGTAVNVTNLKHAVNGGRQVYVGENGTLFAVDPPPAGWTDSGTSTEDLNLGSGDTTGPWSEINDFTLQPQATVEIGDRLDVSVSLWVHLGDSGDPTSLFDKASSIEVGFGINGVDPTGPAATVSLSPYFAGWVNVAFSTIAGSQIQTSDEISIFARRGTGEDSSCNPWVYHTGQPQSDPHTAVLSTPGSTVGGGGAPTDAEYIVASANGSLSAEKILTAGTGVGVAFGAADATVSWDSTQINDTTWGDGTDTFMEHTFNHVGASTALQRMGGNGFEFDYGGGSRHIFKVNNSGAGSSSLNIDGGTNDVSLSLQGDRLFHDTNNDGVKDAGEEFIDLGAGTGAPVDAEYIVASGNPSLTDEKLLTEGPGIAIGFGVADATVSVDINGQPENVSPAANSWVLIENNAGGTREKVQLSNLPGGAGGDPNRNIVKHTFTATAGLPALTLGCADATQKETNFSDNNYVSCVFSGTTNQNWQCEFYLPEDDSNGVGGYAGGDLTVTVNYIGSGAGAVEWASNAVAIGNGDSMDTARGTEGTMTGTPTGSESRDLSSSASVTMANGPAQGDLVKLNIRGNGAADANDADRELIAVTVEYAVNQN